MSKNEKKIINITDKLNQEISLQIILVDKMDLNGPVGN